MKLFVITAVTLLFVAIFASEEEEEKEIKSEADCGTWPSNLLSLKKCCGIPLRFICPWERGCNNICAEENSSFSIANFSVTEEQVDKFRTCIEECFIKFPNALVNSEKQINKTTALRLYFSKIAVTAGWKSQIVAAIEKCEMGSSNSLSANLGQFFYCIDEHLVQNCIDFKRHITGCEDVEDYYKKCNKIQPNCSQWPIDIWNPKLCCDVPQLFNEKIIMDCYEKCDETVYFKQLEAFCIHECIFDKTKIRVDEKYDFEMIKKVINENANKSVDWTTSIDKAVEICEKNITGKKVETEILRNI